MPRKASKKPKDLAESLAPPPPGDSIKTDFSAESGQAESLSPRIKTLDGLLRKACVDQSKYIVDRHVINKWEVGAVGPDGKIVVETLWQVKCWLRGRQGPSLAEFRADLTRELKKCAPVYKVAKFRKRPQKLLGEISLNDQHIGKLCWRHETGSDYDLNIAEQSYRDGLESLLHSFSPYDLDKILLVFGNDGLHADNARNTTHGGTPQDVDGRWQKAFLVALRAYKWAIERCRKIAPTKGIVIPGNHDKERAFYVGCALECQYDKCRDVEIDNRPVRRKYVPWGINLLGFTHGDQEKHQDLPRIMAVEVPELWAKSRHREWHLGHFHRRKHMHWVGTDTFQGCSVRVLPSLSGTDAWHHDQGYVGGMPSAEAYLWDADAGYSGHFNTSRLGS